MKKIFILFVHLLYFLNHSYAQKVNDEYNFPIKKATDKVLIDGIINENSWKESYVARDFYMVQPIDTSYAVAKTEVLMTYDDDNLYIAAINFDSREGNYIVESYRRDFLFNNNDNFIVFIDTYNDLTNGFSFGANAVGAQWDGTQADGGMVNLNWDNKWNSAVKQEPGKWIFEASIPFKTLRYRKEVIKWGINFSRLDLKQREKSSWAPVPTQFATATLAYAGNLVWDQPPPDPGLNISLIPYLSGSAQKDYENSKKTEYQPEVGGDIKFSVTPALNLDLTINPDFSQVEVDQQVTNLSRFELFFPERRQFFLENNDLFANFGFEGYRPFFSRRIGLDNPIIFGGRLSGKIDEKWRTGVMDVATAGNAEEGIPSQNYAVAAIQRYVFSRSNISAIFIDRESLNLDYSEHDSSITKYNRNAGIEYNLASPDNVWKGKFIIHKSFSPGVKGKDLTYAANMAYNTRKVNIISTYLFSGENYNSEVGYIPRNNFNHVNVDFSYRFFVKSKWLLSHGPEFSTENFFDIQWNMTDNQNVIAYGFQFLDRSEFAFGHGFDYVKLLEAFDPTNSGGDTLATGSEYHTNGWGFEYMSTPTRLFTGSLGVMSGGYYNGQILQAEGNIGYRFQPYGRISVDFSYNDIQLPEPYKTEDFWLISPRLDVTFSNKIFLTTFVQYNEQADNFNINSRFQWRFKPASDIYLVYTENYFPGDFTVKNRALVFKITYWYNL